MQIIVLADETQREAFAANLSPNATISWIAGEEDFLLHKGADVFIDLEFVNEDSRKAVLEQLLPKPVVVNSVTDTLADINTSFIRINGWSTFLSSLVIEAAAYNVEVKQKLEEAFSIFAKKIEWLPDDAGFIAARVVSMIINEAFMALGEGVSTKEEINTAMKLGTAYPFGPFEWAEKIGVQNIVTLLSTLSRTEPRYTPSEWLVQETNKGI